MVPPVNKYYFGRPFSMYSVISGPCIFFGRTPFFVYRSTCRFFAGVSEMLAVGSVEHES